MINTSSLFPSEWEESFQYPKLMWWIRVGEMSITETCNAVFQVLSVIATKMLSDLWGGHNRFQGTVLKRNTYYICFLDNIHSITGIAKKWFSDHCHIPDCENFMCPETVAVFPTSQQWLYFNGDPLSHWTPVRNAHHFNKENKDI